MCLFWPLSRVNILWQENLPIIMPPRPLEGEGVSTTSTTTKPVETVATVVKSMENQSIDHTAAAKDARKVQDGASQLFINTGLQGHVFSTRMPGLFTCPGSFENYNHLVCCFGIPIFTSERGKNPLFWLFRVVSLAYLYQACERYIISLNGRCWIPNSYSVHERLEDSGLFNKYK